MTKTFTSFISRKDASLTAFRADGDNNKALLDEISCNAATGYVREGFNCTLVPNHASAAVREHLVKNGWIAL